MWEGCQIIALNPCGLLEPHLPSAQLASPASHKLRAEAKTSNFSPSRDPLASILSPSVRLEDPPAKVRVNDCMKRRRATWEKDVRVVRDRVACLEGLGEGA